MKSIVALLGLLLFVGLAQGAILQNGDFEAAPILGAGQSAVPTGGGKWITTGVPGPNYAGSISGISGWTYALPGSSGTHSDHGLAKKSGNFGLPAGGQLAFINNWNRLMSQTVNVPVGEGYTVNASIDFGTLGSNSDGGRAGRFYLVAGETNPSNRDAFSSRSIILDQVSIANPTWTNFTPDVVVGNGVLSALNLSYTYRANDPALGLPLTVAFRTVSSSVGQTYWDNASLEVESVPEPASLSLALALFGLAGFARRRRQVA